MIIRAHRCWRKPCTPGKRLAKAKSSQHCALYLTELVPNNTGVSQLVAEVGKDDIEDGNEEKIGPRTLKKAFLKD